MATDKEMSRSVGDPCLDLVASVYRLAVRDAIRGNGQAIHWLNVVAPDWRRYVDVERKVNGTNKRRA